MSNTESMPVASKDNDNEDMAAQTVREACEITIWIYLRFLTLQYTKREIGYQTCPDGNFDLENGRITE